jgi:hypothetical protein
MLHQLLWLVSACVYNNNKMAVHNALWGCELASSSLRQDSLVGCCRQCYRTSNCAEVTRLPGYKIRYRCDTFAQWLCLQDCFVCGIELFWYLKNWSDRTRSGTTENMPFICFLDGQGHIFYGCPNCACHGRYPVIFSAHNITNLFDNFQSMPNFPFPIYFVFVPSYFLSHFP